MSRNPTENPRKTGRSGQDKDRRLAEALRANLKRRKAAARPDDPERTPNPEPDSD